MAVKGYVPPVNEMVGRFTEGVRDPRARYKYTERMRQGFTNGWQTWWNYTLAMLIDRAGDWADKKGLDKWEAVKNIVRIASEDYRKAKLGMVVKMYGAELERTKALVEEALAAIGV